MTPEGVEKKAIKEFLEKLGAYQFWPVQTGRGKDTLDCLACISGKFWAIEVKSEDAALGARHGATKRQVLRLEEVEDAGGLAVCGNARMIISMIEQWHSFLRD